MFFYTFSKGKRILHSTITQPQQVESSSLHSLIWRRYRKQFRKTKQTKTDDKTLAFPLLIEATTTATSKYLSISN